MPKSKYKKPTMKNSSSITKKKKGNGANGSDKKTVGKPKRYTK